MASEGNGAAGGETLLRLSALGHDLDLDLAGLVVADREALARSWARCRRAGASHAPRTLHVFTGTDHPPTPGEDDVVGSTPAALAHHLTVRVTGEGLAARRGELLLLHAAAVSDPVTGAVVALVAPSGTGKTTACLSLCQDLGYVSDESVGVGLDLTVHRYPKPLSVIDPGGSGYKKQLGPDDLGLLDTGGHPLHLVGLVLLARDPDRPPALEPVLETLDLADAIIDLAPQVSYLGVLEAPLRRIAAVAAATGGVRRVHYREAETLPTVVRGLLDAARPGGATPTAEPDRGAGHDRGPTGARWRRSDVTDWVRDGDRAVVLVGERVVVVDGIGPLIWELLGAPTSYGEVRAAVVNKFGEPSEGTADDMVSSALATLVEHGLVCRC